jgi:hypothetical protein
MLSGSGTFILNTPHNTYSSWIDNRWLSSLWEFILHAGLSLKTEASWVPSSTRETDSFIMEKFVSITKIPSVLRILNQCRISLKVITISDINSACG